MYQNKLLVSSDTGYLNSLFSVNNNDLSIKKIGSFSSNYLFVFSDKNMDNPIIEEPFPDSEKVNFYILKNNQVLFLAKINLGEK